MSHDPLGAGVNAGGSTEGRLLVVVREPLSTCQGVTYSNQAEEDTHMANPTPGDDTGVGPGREYPGIPRWMKVSGIIVIVLVLLIVIIMFTGVGGKHGPGMHGPGRHMGVGGEHGPRRPMVSTALVATYRPVTLVATHRPVVLAATYRPRQSPSGYASSRTR